MVGLQKPQYADYYQNIQYQNAAQNDQSTERFLPVKDDTFYNKEKSHLFFRLLIILKVPFIIMF